MDLALWAHNNRIPASELAAALSVSEDEARLIYMDIESKRRATGYLHAAPILVQPVLRH
jgi:NAD+ synthase